ncbi:zinc ribbon domain-containing protein [Tissierella praeacuta]|uniref:zinc ribbon domain-containing protein n=1 Tax=Tissierella praeacuta TaxID=43131 RepID=UPI003340E955
MKSKSLFWFITALWIGFGVFPLTLVVLKLGHKEEIPTRALMIFLLALIVVAIMILVICRYVYKDAKSRGMDPYLWMATAAYVPNFVGLIVYLVMRKQLSMEILKCANCNIEVKKDWKYCPNCSHEL